MKKINLLLVVYGIYSGGVEQMIINYFSKDIYQDFNLYIAYSGTPDLTCINKLKKSGFNTIKLKYHTKERLRYYNELCHIIKSKNIDMVHANINIDNFLVLAAAKYCGIKARISHSHGLPLPSKNKTKEILRKIKKALCNLYSTKNLACSKKAGEYLFNNKNFEIIYNATFIQKFQYNYNIRKKIRAELKIDNEIIIGYVARYGPGKNHNFLIEIAQKLNFSNYKFLFIGAGPLKKEIEDKIKRYHLEDKFLVLSSKENIYDYYQAMDLFVFPSKEEGLGMVAIEAQLNGLYCLASKGIPEETKISNEIEFLDLNSDLWIVKIKEHLKKRGKNLKCAFDSKNYDIIEQRKRLYNIYKKVLTNEKRKNK